MNRQELPNTIQLIQHSLTSIILDAIQFYPQETLKSKFESHGLLFGNIINSVLECDYAFPVGNVSSRKNDEIRNNPKVDAAIQNAKHLLFTSKCYGDYHSHPNTYFFREWAYPSNADVLFAKSFKLPYMIIIALSRNSLFEKQLEVEYIQYNAMEFRHKKNAGDHDLPNEVALPEIVNLIQGRFKKYQFEIRAYQCINDSLKSINLISSEAEMLIQLKKCNMSIEDLDPDTTYSLRKIEYDARTIGLDQQGGKEKAMQNMQYHIEKLKQKSSEAD